jgi:hypothetical protein
MVDRVQARSKSKMQRSLTGPWKQVRHQRFTPLRHHQLPCRKTDRKGRLCPAPQPFTLRSLTLRLFL